MKPGVLATSLLVKNYKCFSEFCGFTDIRTSNVLVGRNNVGKSSLLDAFEQLNSNSYPAGALYQIVAVLPREQVAAHFKQGSRSGDIGGLNDWDSAGVYVEDQQLKYNIQNSWSPQHVSQGGTADRFLQTACGIGLIQNYPNRFMKAVVRRVTAERDITAEGANYSDTSFQKNGQGATNFVQRIINSSEIDSSLIQKDVVEAFNDIMFPDYQVKNIITQTLPSQLWEIFFVEPSGATVALSKSGSGLKTVLLVLLNLLTVPKVAKREVSDHVFLFEELENNLHPALQRRLFDYIHRFATENGCIIFYTTHSNVVIDLFSKHDNASLTLIRRESGVVRTEQIRSVFEKRTVLEELDIRASDLLQTNALVWVEGPSDRVYLNRYIEIFCGGRVREGVHFQYLYYGGKLLSHYTAGEDDLDNLIKIVAINRNSILVADSDKKNRQSPINESKKRIESEFQAMGLQFWVTKGREIENYLPGAVVTRYLKVESTEVFDQYSDISEYLERISPGSGKRFERNKVLFAEGITKVVTSDDVREILDLRSQIEELVTRVEGYNKV